MKLYTLSGDVLYEGNHNTTRTALIHAVRDNVPLAGVNLRRARLKGAALDGMHAPGACLWGADLTRCDLAGALLSHADLRMANVVETCLADSDCSEVQWQGAYFRHVILTGAILSGGQFSCPSILEQPLHLCRALSQAFYWHQGERALSLEGGFARLTAGAQDIVMIGGRLIVNGALQDEKIFPGSYATQSSRNQPKFAICDEL